MQVKKIESGILGIGLGFSLIQELLDFVHVEFFEIMPHFLT